MFGCYGCMVACTIPLEPTADMYINLSLFLSLFLVRPRLVDRIARASSNPESRSQSHLAVPEPDLSVPLLDSDFGLFRTNLRTPTYNEYLLGVPYAQCFSGSAGVV